MPRDPCTALQGPHQTGPDEVLSRTAETGAVRAGRPATHRVGSSSTYRLCPGRRSGDESGSTRASALFVAFLRRYRPDPVPSCPSSWSWLRRLGPPRARGARPRCPRAGVRRFVERALLDRKNGSAVESHGSAESICTASSLGPASGAYSKGIRRTTSSGVNSRGRYWEWPEGRWPARMPLVGSTRGRQFETVCGQIADCHLS